MSLIKCNFVLFVLLFSATAGTTSAVGSDNPTAGPDRVAFVHAG